MPPKKDTVLILQLGLASGPPAGRWWAVLEDQMAAHVLERASGSARLVRQGGWGGLRGATWSCVRVPGPPGTGKTVTSASIVYQLVKAGTGQVRAHWQ